MQKGPKLLVDAVRRAAHRTDAYPSAAEGSYPDNSWASAQ